MAKAQIRRHLGRATLFIDDAPAPIMSWMNQLGDYRFGPETLGRDEYLDGLRETGIRVYFLGASAHPRYWADVVATTKRLLKHCPDAYIIYRVAHNKMDDDWLAAHPYDLFRFSDGTSDVREGDFMDWASKHPEEGWFDQGQREAFFQRGYHAYWEQEEDFERNNATSFASLAWREELTAGIRSFIERVRESEFADRVIGYFPAVGRWEWFVTCASVDYSPVMRDAFREWCMAHYGDEKALALAWHDEALTFDRVTQPNQSLAGLGDVGFFRSGAQQQAIDYFRCHNEVVADTIIAMAAAIKNAAGREALAGFCYGYMMTIHYSLNGHAALRKVLDCPEVDFIESCVPYEGRPAGNDHPLPTVVQSLDARDKLLWFEADIRTHRSDGYRTAVVYGAPADEAGSISLLTREFAHYLTSGIQAYWFDQQAKYYDDPALLKLLKRFQQIADFAMVRPAGRTADIGYFIDEDSFFHVEQEISINVLHRQRIQEMGRGASPYDIWLLDDIARDDLPDYRLCVFPNAYSLNDAQRKMIRDKLCRDGRTILWQYAPGLINQGVIDPANVTELTGIGVDWIRQRKHLELITTGEPDGLPADFRFGDFRDDITTGAGIGLGGRESITPPPVLGDPTFVVDDPDAVIAAHYTWDRLPGMAVKDMGDWTSIYCAALCVPHELIGAMIDRSGVHRYSDPGDVVYANDQFLAVHTRGGGDRRIRLRQKTDVVDALTGQTIARDVDQFNAPLADKSSYLYFLGSESDWPEHLRTDWRGAL